MREERHLSAVPDLPRQDALRYVPQYDYHSGWRTADLVVDVVNTDLFWLVSNRESFTNPTMGPQFYPDIEIDSPTGKTTACVLVFQNPQVLHGTERPVGIRRVYLNLNPAVIIAGRPVGSFGFSVTSPEEITITYADEDPATAPLNTHNARDDFVMHDETYLMATVLLHSYAENLKFQA